MLSNALTPGWVPTRMGGSSAPDDLAQAHRKQDAALDLAARERFDLIVSDIDLPDDSGYSLME